MRTLSIAALAAALTAHRAAAQDAPQAPSTPEPWSFSLSATLISAPDTGTYLQPTLTADRGLLHLEARYNYESLNTASLWIGCNLGAEPEKDGLTFNLTPMLGLVVGDATGIAPGYELALAWGPVELYTEGEYVYATHDKTDSYFYSWSQLTIAPTDWLYAGFAAQRTQAYHSDRELDVGPIIGIVYKDLDFSVYALNPEDDHPIIGVNLTWSF